MCGSRRPGSAAKGKRLGMWQALPLVMDYLDKRKAAQQAKQQQASALLQQSAQRLGAPSTAGVTAAGAMADDRRAQHSQFADLLAQLAGGQAPGAPSGDRGQMARMLMQMSRGYGGGRGGGAGGGF